MKPILLFSFIITITTINGNNSIEYGMNRTEFENLCSDNWEIDNGKVTILKTPHLTAHIECNIGFDLEGPPKILCVNDQWEQSIHPRCIPRCLSPPYIKNGAIKIESDENGTFKKGTVVTYSCGEGFMLSPPDSQYRVCEKGIWTGALASCVPVEKVTGCKPPKDLENGYYVNEKFGDLDVYEIGQRLHYSCNTGYVLIGSRFQSCLEDGNWSPKLPPVCTPREPLDETPCPPIPSVPQALTTVVSGFQALDQFISGTEVEVRCMSKYRNLRSPCQVPSRLRCIAGHWAGALPKCVQAKECPPPPPVLHGKPIEYQMSSMMFETSRAYKYPINMRITYQCAPGYEIEGNEILTCSSGGCWSPNESPMCRASGEYYLSVNGSVPILVSLATGTGVLLLLVILCVVIVCRRKKPMSRAVAIPPPVQRPGLGDHASLLHHPDRLALIAFADGIQVGQPVLPTYEEATRDRGPGFMSTRLQRPHWPSLVARRARGSPNPDLVHVTRQGSFASHTPSTRSGGDPMGSTDTVAVSENSTTVTLDTASSHSGSQPASCRAHCGSLASFDTNSVLNTEGVPLLEESELEEIQGGDAVSLAMENRSMADNNSFKFSTSTDTA